MKKAFLALIIFLGSFPLLASHLDGGQIYWDALGNNQYKFTLQLIRRVSGASLSNNLSITTNVPGVANVSLTRIAVAPLNDYCNGSTGGREYELNTYESGIITLPAPVAGTPWQFVFNLCCMPGVNALNIDQVSGKTFYLEAKMFVNGSNRHCPRINLHTVLHKKLGRNLLVAEISKNARPVELSLAPLLDQTGAPYSYISGFSHLKPTSPLDTLLPYGLFVSGNTDADGLAFLCFLAEERMPTGQMIATTRITFGYSFEGVPNQERDPSTSVPYGNTAFTAIDSNVIHIKSGMGHHIQLNLQGAVRIGVNSSTTLIKGSYDFSSTSHLNIPQPQLTHYGSTSLVDTGILNLTFDYTVPFGYPTGVSRYIVTYEDIHCPQNGMSTQIIEIENSGKYLFEYQVCEGDSFQLISPVNGQTYEWYPSLDVSNPFGQTTYVSPSTVKKYNLIVDGDTVAYYRFKIDRAVNPVIRVNSYQQLELLNPNDYSEHQLYWFYMKIPSMKNDTVFNITHEGLYHMRGGIPECSQYSDSLYYQPGNRTYLSLLDDFMDPDNLVPFTATVGTFYFQVNFGTQSPSSIDQVIFPYIIAQNHSDVFELSYEDTIVGARMIATAQIQPDNSLIFNLNSPINAFNNQYKMILSVRSGQMMLPIFDVQVPFGRPNAQVDQIELAYANTRVYNKGTQVVFGGSENISIGEVDLSGSIYPQPADNILLVETSVPNAEYSIFNMNGQMLKHGHLDENNSINTTELPSGMYTLEIHEALQHRVQKILIRH